MQRRTILSALAALVLSACASGGAAPATQGFISERISVVTRGHGPDVILIPGLTSSRDVWAATADALEGDYTLHIVQVNGFAGAPVGANGEGAVAAPVAEEIARYIAETHLDRPALVGHSMGGTMAMMVAARHPDAVGRVMVVDMVPFLGALFAADATPEGVRPIADQFRAGILAGPPGVNSPAVVAMISNMTNTESVRPALLEQARTSNKPTVANAYHELIVTDLQPELANIRAPLTVLYVQPPSVPMPAEQFDGLYRLFYANATGARLIRIPDSYHFIQIDQAARFQQEVREFMAR